MSGKVITIFGASRPLEGSKQYEDSVKMGEFLAKLGYVVRNGGYSGTMEGASKGVKKMKGVAEGCICSPIFKTRPRGNEYLTKVIDHETLLMRIQKLTDEDVAAYVILPGNIGTLTELFVIWCLKYIGVRGDVPVFLFRDPFFKLVKLLREMELVTDGHLEMLTFVDSIEDCMKKIEEMKI